MRIVSVPGRVVRDPVTRRAVDETGIDIDENDPSWSRLLADGDVVAAPPAAEAATTEVAAQSTPAKETSK